MNGHFQQFEKKQKRAPKKREICSFQMDEESRKAYEYLGDRYNVSALLRHALQTIVKTIKSEKEHNDMQE